jgi:hypothetical protein
MTEGLISSLSRSGQETFLATVTVLALVALVCFFNSMVEPHSLIPVLSGYSLVFVLLYGTLLQYDA